MVKGYKIHVNGDVTPVHVKGCKSIQSIVGGYFDVVSSKSGETSFWVNDEGKLTGMPPNHVATKVLWILNPDFVGRDYLAGPVLITGGVDAEGETLGVGLEAEIVLRCVSPLGDDWFDSVEP